MTVSTVVKHNDKNVRNRLYVKLYSYGLTPDDPVLVSEYWLDPGQEVEIPLFSNRYLEVHEDL